MHGLKRLTTSGWWGFWEHNWLLQKKFFSRHVECRWSYLSCVCLYEGHTSFSFLWLLLVWLLSSTHHSSFSTLLTYCWCSLDSSDCCCYPCCCYCCSYWPWMVGNRRHPSCYCSFGRLQQLGHRRPFLAWDLRLASGHGLRDGHCSRTETVGDVGLGSRLNSSFPGHLAFSIWVAFCFQLRLMRVVRLPCPLWWHFSLILRICCHSRALMHKMPYTQ